MIGAGQVCLGWIRGETVHGAFMDSVLGVLADPSTGPMITRYESFSAGAHLAAARNQVALQFLAKGPEPWLLMLDTDLIFEPALLHILADTADPDVRPLLTGVYLTTTRGGLPLVPMIYDRTLRPDNAQPEFTPRRDWRGAGVLEVAGCGAGCLLVHRRVLDAIAAESGPEWFTEITASGRVYGEDLSFCLRAAEAGFTIYADTAARAGHVKPVVVGLPGTALDAPVNP